MLGGAITPVTVKKIMLKAEWQEQAVFNETPVFNYSQRLVILGEMGESCSPEGVLENMGVGIGHMRASVNGHVVLRYNPAGKALINDIKTM